MSFGETALRLFTLAARTLGWRPHEFWAATPAELSAALAPPDSALPGIDRHELNRLMEHDDA